MSKFHKCRFVKNIANPVMIMLELIASQSYGKKFITSSKKVLKLKCAFISTSRKATLRSFDELSGGPKHYYITCHITIKLRIQKSKAIDTTKPTMSRFYMSATTNIGTSFHASLSRLTCLDRLLGYFVFSTARL